MEVSQKWVPFWGPNSKDYGALASVSGYPYCGKLPYNARKRTLNFGNILKPRNLTPYGVPVIWTSDICKAAIFPNLYPHKTATYVLEGEGDLVSRLMNP